MLEAIMEFVKNVCFVSHFISYAVFRIQNFLKPEFTKSVVSKILYIFFGQDVGSRKEKFRGKLGKLL